MLKQHHIALYLEKQCIQTLVSGRIYIFQLFEQIFLYLHLLLYIRKLDHNFLKVENFSKNTPKVQYNHNYKVIKYHVKLRMPWPADLVI